MTGQQRGWLVFPLAMTLATYFELPKLYFFSDDFTNLVTIENRGPLRFIIELFNGHMNFTRHTIFYLVYALFGFRSEPHGWLALCVHLLNVTLFFRIALTLVRSVELAAAGAAIWGSCPLLAGSLGWYAVNGQAFGVTFLLIVLDGVVSADHRRERIPARSALGWGVLLVLGSACFGTGIAAAIASPVVVALLVRKPRRQSVAIAIFAVVSILVVAIYYGWRRLYFAYVEPMRLADHMQQVYAFGDLRPAFSATGFFLSYGVSGLVRGLGMGAVSDVTWWVVVVYGVLVATAIVHANALCRRRIISFVLLACATYGIVALGRANASLHFAGFPPSVVAGEIRYHYAGTMPLAMTMPLVLRLTLPANRIVPLSRVLLAGQALLAIYFHVRVPFALGTHGDCRTYVAGVLQDVDSRIDKAPPGSAVFVPNTPAPGFCTGVMVSYEEIPGTAAFFMMAHRRNVIRGRSVFFVEPEEKRGEFRDPINRRLSRLLVSEIPTR